MRPTATVPTLDRSRRAEGGRQSLRIRRPSTGPNRPPRQPRRARLRQKRWRALSRGRSGHSPNRPLRAPELTPKTEPPLARGVSRVAVSVDEPPFYALSGRSGAGIVIENYAQLSSAKPRCRRTRCVALVFEPCLRWGNPPSSSGQTGQNRRVDWVYALRTRPAHATVESCQARRRLSASPYVVASGGASSSSGS